MFFFTKTSTEKWFQCAHCSFYSDVRRSVESHSKKSHTWPVVKFGPLYPTFRKEKMPDGSTKIFLKNHDEWRIWIRWEEPFSDGSYWSAEKIGPLKNNEATKRAFKKKKIWPFPSSKDEKSKTKSILLKKRGYTE